MAKSSALKIRHPLYEDETGVVYRAKDASGHRVNLRKPKPGSVEEKSLQPMEEIAYQVAIERLTGYPPDFFINNADPFEAILHPDDQELRVIEPFLRFQRPKRRVRRQ